MPSNCSVTDKDKHILSISAHFDRAGCPTIKFDVTKEVYAERRNFHYLHAIYNECRTYIREFLFVFLPFFSGHTLEISPLGVAWNILS